MSASAAEEPGKRPSRQRARRPSPLVAGRSRCRTGPACHGWRSSTTPSGSGRCRVRPVNLQALPATDIIAALGPANRATQRPIGLSSDRPDSRCSGPRRSGADRQPAARSLIGADLAEHALAAGRSPSMAVERTPSRRGPPTVSELRLPKSQPPPSRDPQPPHCDPAVTQPPASRMTAVRANESARPAQPLKVVQAVVVSAEPGKELAGRSRVVRARDRCVMQTVSVRLSGYPRAS